MIGRGPALVGTLLMLAALSGCSAAPGAEQPIRIVQTYRGTAVAQKTESSSDAHPTIYWTEGRRYAVLSAYGSSSCPPVPDSVVIRSATAIDLHLKDYNTPCTADLGATTSEFALPSTVSRADTVRVLLIAAGQATTTLHLTNDPTIAAHRN